MSKWWWKADYIETCNCTHGCSLVLPFGFIFRDARIVNTDQCEVTLPGLEFHHANSNAFFSEVEYNV